MLRIRGLHKSYGDKPVLRGIDLDVAAGEFVVILGSSGAGKSTLLRSVNRLVDVDRGTLEVAGIDVVGVDGTGDLRALRRQVAMIFQHHNLVPRLSVLRNVLTGRLGAVPTWSSVLQLFRGEDVALARDCLARVGLDTRADARADALSGGQMQRVGIARALAQQPKLILADEPVASLDPQTARQVLEYLRGASRELGIAVVCNLHQLDYATEFGDRIVGMAGGRIVFDRPPNELTAPDIDRIYAAAPATVPAPPIASSTALIAAGA